MPDSFANAKAVFFDIDGTLLDAFPTHIAAYENAFHHVTGIRVTDPAFFKSKFSLGAERHVWQDALAHYGLTRDEQTFNALLSRRSVELAALAHQITPRQVLKGAVQTLRKLEQRGVRLYAVSGNTREVGEQLLAHTGLKRFFHSTVYSNDDPSIQNKVTLIGFALKKSGFAPNDVVVVGDTPEDIRAAKTNGCRFLAVATGHHSLTELRDHAGKHARKGLFDPKPARPKRIRKRPRPR